MAVIRRTYRPPRRPEVPDDFSPGPGSAGVSGGQLSPFVLRAPAKFRRQPLWGDDDGLPRFFGLDDEYHWTNKHRQYHVPVQAFRSDESWVVDIPMFPWGGGGRDTSPLVITLPPRQPTQPWFDQAEIIGVAVVDEDPPWRRPVNWQTQPPPAFTSDEDTLYLLLPEDGLWIATTETWEPAPQAFISDEDVLGEFIAIEEEYWWSNSYVGYLPPPQAFTADDDVLATEWIGFEDEYLWTNPGSIYLPPPQAFISNEDERPQPPPLAWVGPQDITITVGTNLSIADQVTGGLPPLIFTISIASPVDAATLLAGGVTLSADGTFTAASNADLVSYDLILTVTDQEAATVDSSAFRLTVVSGRRQKDAGRKRRRYVMPDGLHIFATIDEALDVAKELYGEATQLAEEQDVPPAELVQLDLPKVAVIKPVERTPVEILAEKISMLEQSIADMQARMGVTSWSQGAPDEQITPAEIKKGLELEKVRRRLVKIMMLLS